MQILLLIALIAAFAAGLVVMRSAVRLLRLAPSGGRIAALADLTRWRFFELAQRIGADSHEHIARFRLGALAFIASVGAAALLFAACTTLRDTH